MLSLFFRKFCRFGEKLQKSHRFAPTRKLINKFFSYSLTSYFHRYSHTKYICFGVIVFPIIKAINPLVPSNRITQHICIHTYRQITFSTFSARFARVQQIIFIQFFCQTIQYRIIFTVSSRTIDNFQSFYTYQKS